MLKQLSQSLSSQKQIVEVVAVHSDGTVTVWQGNGDEWRVVGTAAVGAAVYVKDGGVVGASVVMSDLMIEV